MATKPKKWTPPTPEERAAIIARNEELDKERIKRNASWAKAIPPGGIEFKGDPAKARTYIPTVGWQTKADHAKFAAQRAAEADAAFEKWERENHPAKAGLRAFNDSLIHVARKVAIPGGFLDHVLPHESGLHKDHVVHKIAKAVDPLVDVALAAVGAGLLNKTQSKKMDYEREEHEEGAGLCGGAPRLKCPHCNKCIPKKTRTISSARREQLSSDGKLRAEVYHALKDAEEWTRLTDASRFIKEKQQEAEARTGRSFSLKEVCDAILAR